MRHIKHNTWFQIGSGLLAGIACLWLSYRSTGAGQVIGRLDAVAWPWVGLAVLCVVLVSVGKAVRWHWLYPQGAQPVSYGAHFGILQIGQMLNLLVPVRLGEVARLGLMRQEGRPAAMTLGTVVVEKSLDLLAVGALTLLAVPLAILPDWLRPEVGVGTLLTGLGLLGILLGVAAIRGRVLGWLAARPVPHRRPWARLWPLALKVLRATLEGIAGVESRRLPWILGLTALVWLVSVAQMQAMLMAFQLYGLWHVALVLMIGIISSNLVPTPPAMIGIVGAVSLAVLRPFGVPADEALALGAVLNLVLVAPPVILGGWAAGIRLVRLLSQGRQGHLREALGLSHTKPQRGVGH